MKEVDELATNYEYSTFVLKLYILTGNENSRRQGVGITYIG